MNEEDVLIIYKKNWHLAYDVGVEARIKKLPNICNLMDKKFLTPSGNILKVYKSAWQQGYDNYKIPIIFSKMEDIANKLPLRELKEEDI